MPYVDDETYAELLSFRDKTDQNARQMEILEQMYHRLNRQFQDIISRYGAIPNPLISRQVVEELRVMGKRKLEAIYGQPTKTQTTEMWKQFRNYFEIKRITQVCVSQIPDAMRFLERWVPIEVIHK